MEYLPLFLNTKQLNCLVIGAGEVGARKIELLCKTQAKVTVVAPDVCDTVMGIAQSGRIQLHQRVYKEADLTGVDLLYIATSDEALNADIHQQAVNHGVLVNVVDNQPLCQFITPSIIDRSPVTIAMASGGVAPVLLRQLRQKLESTIPANIGLLGQFCERFRDRVKHTFKTVTERRYFWEDVLEGNIAEQVMAGNLDNAEQEMEGKLAEPDLRTNGEVYLVGAGPGDPDLLTFRALRLMQKADVVVYDRLVSKGILELVRRDAEKIYVGKAKSNHTLPQQDISQLLVDKAKEGLRVVRLKGGDPFIFGRGGEEIETLVQHHISFQVVPGITAANGASSYAGIPLTHRDHAQSVVFATGHLKDDSIDLNWSALAHANQTVVFYMGLTGLAIICQQLISHGLAADTPIAIVESATTDRQKVIVSDLANMPDEVKNHDIKPPSLIIVGSVVNLHGKLNWFKQEQ